MLFANRLLEEAKIASGLEDYGTMEFFTGLQVLVNAVNTESGLTPDNEAKFGNNLVRILANRLRMQRDLVRHPEILDEEILPPVFITSLPRTGSTKMHRMLAASQDFHSMSYWQVFNFAPFQTGQEQRPDPRIAAADENLAWIRDRSPLLMETHPMFTHETEEERFLLDAGFNSLYNHAAFLNIPSYIQWVLAQEPSIALRDLRRILQYMQWQHHPGKRRRWVLKTPALLGTEGAFDQVFPGTDFIVTHRHPEKIVASVCALICSLRALYNDDDQSGLAGSMMFQGFGETIKGHLHWRSNHGDEHVLDARFEDIVGDEFALLEQVYEFLGIPFNDASRHNIEAWLKMDMARRTPSRQFQLSDYGLNAADVNEKFAGYIKRYKEYL